jgi:plasmid segregation protein ParM
MLIFESIGADMGYSFVKIITGNEKGDRTIFPSSYYRTFLKEELYNNINVPIKESIIKNLIIDYNNSRYYIGDIARKEDSGVNKDFSEEKFKKEHEIVKLLAGISLLTNDNHLIINNLTMGLNMSVFNKYKDEIIDFYSNKIFNYKFRNNTYTVEIRDVLCIPQGIGAFWDQVMNDDAKIISEELLDGRFGVIDIGGRTTDAFIADESQILRGTEFSFTSAMTDIFKDVTSELKIDFPSSILEKVFIEGKDSIFWINKEYSIKKELEKAIERLAERIFTEVRYVWDKRLDRAQFIILCGGGASALGNYLAEYFCKKVILVDDPQFSNAKGFYKLGLNNAGKND